MTQKTLKYRMLYLITRCMFYFPQGLLCVPAEDKMTQKTLKYRMLLKGTGTLWSI